MIGLVDYFYIITSCVARYCAIACSCWVGHSIKIQAMIFGMIVGDFFTCEVLTNGNHAGIHFTSTLLADRVYSRGKPALTK